MQGTESGSVGSQGNNLSLNTKLAKMVKRRTQFLSPQKDQKILDLNSSKFFLSLKKPHFVLLIIPSSACSALPASV